MNNIRQLMLFFAIAVVIALSVSGCDTECSGSESDNVSTPEPTQVYYKFENVEFNSLTLKIDASTDAPDGVEFVIKMNGQTVTAKSYNQSLKFDVFQCFTKNDKGGTEYEAKISTDVAEVLTKSVNLGYWPKASFRLNCEESSIIWNGSTETYVPPSFVSNYEKNYETKQWFEVFDENGLPDSTSTSNWKLADMLKFLSDENNDGKSVKVHFSVTPVKSGTELTDLKAEGYVEYICRKDVLIQSAEIERYYDRFIVIGYDSTLNDESKDYAGGDVVYEWQIADSTADDADWTSLNENMQIHSISSSQEIGKYLRASLTQTYQDQEQEPIVTAAVKINNQFSESGLRYNKVLQVGDKPSISDIDGEFKNIFNETVTGVTYELSEGNNSQILSDGMGYSDYAIISVSKDNYDEYLDYVFVPVKNVISEDELPALSDEPWNITYGKIKFYDANILLEYSVNKGLSWNLINTELEFDPPQSDDASSDRVILVRKRSVGDPNEKGYLAASDPLPITVAENNIGTKTEMSGISADIKNTSLELFQKTVGDAIQVTATVQNVSMDSAYAHYREDYIWRIDGVLADSFDYITVNKDVIYIEKDSLTAGETYQISVTYRLYHYIDGENDLDLLKEHSQISVVVQ